MPEHDDDCEHGDQEHEDDPRHWLTPIRGDRRPSVPSREIRQGLTKDPGETFEQLWSETAQSLDALLRARGLTSQDRADVIQEVAAHALRAHANGAITTSFGAWCKAVARNTVVAMYRRDRWIDLTNEFDVEAHDEDVEHHVEHRLEFDAFASVWQSLDADQRALLVDDDPPADTAARNRHYVALHRLRKRVRLLVESAVLGLTVALYAARRRSMGGAAAALGAVGIVATVTIGVAGLRQLAPSDSGVRATPPPSIVDRPTASLGHPSQPAATTRSSTRESVGAPLPAGHRAYVWTRQPDQPDEPLVCARVALVTDRTCVAHPLRRKSGDPFVTVR